MFSTTYSPKDILAVAFEHGLGIRHHAVELDAISTDDWLTLRFFCAKCLDALHVFKDGTGHLASSHRSPGIHCKWYDDGDRDSLLDPQCPNSFFDFFTPYLQGDTDFMVQQARKIGAARRSLKVSTIVAARSIGDLVECYWAKDLFLDRSIFIPLSDAVRFGELFMDLSDERTDTFLGNDRRIYFGRATNASIFLTSQTLQIEVEASNGKRTFAIGFENHESQVAERAAETVRQKPHYAYVLGSRDDSMSYVEADCLSSLHLVLANDVLSRGKSHK